MTTKTCMWYRDSTRPNSTDMEAPDRCRAVGCMGWKEDCHFHLELIETMTFEEYSKIQDQAKNDREVDMLLHGVIR